MADGPDVTKTSNIQLELDQQAQQDMRQQMVDYDANELRQSNEAAEKWIRLRKGMIGELKDFVKQIKEEAIALGTVNHQVKDLTNSTTAYLQKLRSLTSISQVYKRTLDEMRKGQLAFSGSVQATTGSVGDAMAKSQQYVDAVTASYANANRLASEYHVEADAIRNATDQLTSRFADQIGAMDNVSAGLKTLQKNALVYSRYFGVEMPAMMDLWEDRLSQSNMTMEQAQKETALLARESDKYVKSLKAMEGQLAKTGIIGKKEFLRMVTDSGKALRTGTIDATAYAAALRGLLIEGEKGKQTANEQRVLAEGTQKVFASMFTSGGELEIFGKQAAISIDALSDLGGIQNKALRERLKIVRERHEGDPDIIRFRAISDVLRGSAAGQAEGLKRMNIAASKDLLNAVLPQFFDNNTFIAGTFTEQMNSGKLVETLKDQGDTDEEGKKEQADVWDQGVKELIKAGATPTKMQYKMAAMVDSMKNTLEAYVREFPLIIMGAQLGGSVLQGLMARGGGAGLLAGGGGGGGGLLARLLGRGAPKPGAAGFIGPMAPGATPGVMSRVGSTAMGGLAAVGGGAMVGGMAPQLFGLSKGEESTGALMGAGTGGALFAAAKIGGAKIAAPLMAGLVAGTGIRYGLGAALKDADTERELGAEAGDLSAQMSLWAIDDDVQEQITRVRGGEYQRRKKMLKAMDQKLKDLKNDHRLSEEEKKLRELKLREERRRIADPIERRMQREKEEVMVAKYTETALRPEKILDAFRQDFGADGAPAWQRSGTSMFEHSMQAGQFNIRDFRSAGFYEKVMEEAKGTGASPEVIAEFQRLFQKQMLAGTAESNLFGGRNVRDLSVTDMAKVWSKKTQGQDLPITLTPQQQQSMKQKVEIATTLSIEGAQQQGVAQPSTNVHDTEETSVQTMLGVTAKQRVNAGARASQAAGMQNRLGTGGSPTP